MSLIINKSAVPRSAVEKTIRRGIELWELANDGKKCPPEVVKKITDVVHAQARIMNIERGYGDHEARAVERLVG